MLKKRCNLFTEEFPTSVLYFSRGFGGKSQVCVALLIKNRYVLYSYPALNMTEQIKDRKLQCEQSGTKPHVTH